MYMCMYPTLIITEGGDVVIGDVSVLEKDEKQEEVHVDDRRDSKADAAAEIQKLYSQMRAGRKKSGSITSIGSPAGVLKLEKPPAIPEGRYCKKCPSTCTCITCTRITCTHVHK